MLIISNMLIAVSIVLMCYVYNLLYLLGHMLLIHFCVLVSSA